MQAWFNGRTEALGGLIKIASDNSNGHALDACVQAIQLHLGQEMEKNASEEDYDENFGMEEVCHDFLKYASRYFGTHVVEDYDEALCDILDIMVDEHEKIAEEAADKTLWEKVKGHASTFGAKAKEVGQKVNPFSEAGKQQRAHAADRLKMQKPGANMTSGQRLKAMASKHAPLLAGLGLAGAAAGAGAAYYRHKKNQEKEK